MTIPYPLRPALRVRSGVLNNQPYLLLSLTLVVLGCNIVLARHVGGPLPPITLTCIRWFGSS